MKRLLTAVAPFVLALGVAACSSASGGQPGSATPNAGSPDAGGPTANGSQIVAKDIAFQQSSLTVKAGTAFDLQFVNQDSAPHNVAIYTDSSASTAVMVGEVIQGGETRYQVPALAAGSYFFRCDVHPDMKGTITAQ
jgi:plastocyanin